jgi:hypothetical protein
MMPHGQAGKAVGVGVCAILLLGLASCGFGDLFRAAGPRDVVITYSGGSVLSVGDSLPFTITVTANGVSLVDPAVTVESSDTLVLSLTASRDSLLALSTGTSTLTARLSDPAFTDSLPTLTVRIRVRGNGSQ